MSEEEKYIDMVCRDTWNHCYADRRPWDCIDEGARQEWRRVIGRAIEVHDTLSETWELTDLGREALAASKTKEGAGS